MNNRTIHAAWTAVLAMGVSTWAAPVTWDGNGTPDASGNWSVAENWDDADGLTADAVPTSVDDVTLQSVSTGPRIVTQDISTGTTIGSLTIQQSGTVAINRLSLSGDMSFLDTSRDNATVDSTTSAYRVTLSDSATPAQVQLDLNGYDLIFLTQAGGATTGANLAGTINFNIADSKIRVTPVGHTGFNVFGTLNVTANGFLGRDNGTSQTSGNTNFTVQSTGSIAVTNNAVLQAGAIGRFSQNRAMTFSNNGMVSIESGSVLRTALDNAGTTATTNTWTLAINNNATGTLTHGGNLAVRPFQGATSTTTTTTTITNNGTWVVSGSAATLTRLTTSTTTGGTPAIIVPTFTIGSTGVLKGASALDALEFNEEVDFDNRMTVTNDGQLSPGDGTNGAGTASVGTLALRDINATFGATGRLNVDIGGTSAGEYDVLALETGSTDPAGAGTLDLSAAGDRLNVTLVNGFAPGGDFAIPILTYGTVTGEFDILAVNGLTDNAATWSDGVGVYSVSYGGGSANLMYTVPEPGTAGLIATAGLALLRRRRRPA